VTTADARIERDEITVLLATDQDAARADAARRPIGNHQHAAQAGWLHAMMLAC
jgi:hypothetical protein